MTHVTSDQPGSNCYDHEIVLRTSTRPAEKYFQIKLTPLVPLGTAEAFVYDLHLLKLPNSQQTKYIYVAFYDVCVLVSDIFR